MRFCMQNFYKPQASCSQSTDWLTDWRTGRWTDGWTDGQTDNWLSDCCLTDVWPLQSKWLKTNCNRHLCNDVKFEWEPNSFFFLGGGVWRGSGGSLRVSGLWVLRVDQISSHTTLTVVWTRLTSFCLAISRYSLSCLDFAKSSKSRGHL